MAEIPVKSSSAETDAPPVVTTSLHGEFLQQASPAWLVGASTQQRQALKDSDTTLPDWYRRASRDQRKAMSDAATASLAAQGRLDKTLSNLQDIDSFAEPLLTKALKDRFNVTLDVNKTWLVLNKPLELSVLDIELGDFEVLRIPLLQAALHNFEAKECHKGTFHKSSGFYCEAPEPDKLAPLSTTLTVEQFTGLCRSLDIGAKYQDYLKAKLYPVDSRADQSDDVLHDDFIEAHKTALRAAAEVALVKGDISRQDHGSILEVLDGERAPRQGPRQLWFRDLQLMGRRMTGCVMFSLCEKHRHSDDVILYIPGDPLQPLKRYKGQEIAAMFKQRFTARDVNRSAPEQPNAYQQFFSRFVAYADRPNYFSQFTEDAPTRPVTEKLKPYALKLYSFFTASVPIPNALFGINELPPLARVPQVPNEDPYLHPVEMAREGSGLWADNVDLFSYQFDQYRARLLADAKSHAVPTAEVDARVRKEKLSALLGIGMLVLTGASLFVPGLGEVMMGVMAGQLLYETFEGIIEWHDGDLKAAKAHLVDVAENLALIAVTVGVGKGLAGLSAARSVPVIEKLQQIELPDGTARLWKPDLTGYESTFNPPPDAVPNAMGQYETDHGTCIRLDGKTYRQTYDESLKAWRINHPSDPLAYQPPLAHNDAGAWRLTLERPQKWDRLTLLRRMGHTTDAFADEQLLQIADIAGVSDNALRKMHLDNALPPPELSDALRLFRTGRDMAPDTGPVDLRVARLQRISPGLSNDAARAVLRQADAGELARLDGSEGVPLHLQELSRWYAGEWRLTRALAGLHRESLASTDSARLGLRTLGRLPGWSDEIRLELREGSVRGPLIEGIGSVTSPSRRFLVKNGAAWQAFDERARPLNSLPASGDSFYSSLMHALPDETRGSLGVPATSQHAGLQKLISDYAVAHRAESAQVFQPASRPQPWFKPPQRIASKLIGYPASGDGPGPDPLLTSRVQDVYPGLSDTQARGFILEQWRGGKTDQQIFHLLNNRMKEWGELETTLNQWMASQAPQGGALDEHRCVVQNIKDCWRNSPLAEHSPQSAGLTLSSKVALPTLTADFSHVRELTLNAPQVAETLATFPSVEKLELNAGIEAFDEVLAAMKTLLRMTRLKLTTPITATAAFRLRELTWLEELELRCTANHESPQRIDFSGMLQLRRLEIVSPQMREFPQGLLDLPKLERLNLRATSIIDWPPEMNLAEHRRLLSGLSLGYSNAEGTFYKTLFNLYRNQPHMIDLDGMMVDYCRVELKRLPGMEQARLDSLVERFTSKFPDTASRFAAVETLSEQIGELDRLHDWVGSGETSENGRVHRMAVAEALRNSWRNGLFQRAGEGNEPLPSNLSLDRFSDFSALDILGVPMDSLPSLPGELFDHVRSLHLAGLEAPQEQMRGFLRTFRAVDTLDLSYCGLTELPLDPEALAKLENLNLNNNPLTRIDVGDGTSLKSLDLSNTALSQWPAGAEDLPNLTWLDLGDTRLSTLPDVLLANDRLVLATNLNAVPLTEQAKMDLALARQRIERGLGLSDGALQRFALEASRNHTLPEESGSVVAQRLLPLPPVPEGKGAAVWPRRIQRLCPEFDDARAQTTLRRMQEAGLSGVQISARIEQWERVFDALTRRLNGWVFTHETRGMDWVVSSRTRQLAAQRILDCWRRGAIDWNGVADLELDLDGLQVGDLPELPEAMPAVSNLNLAGVRLSASGSNGFLEAFSRLRRLDLTGNHLLSIPEPVAQMQQLEQLRLAFTGLDEASSLYPTLERLTRLQSLNLSHNNLRDFNVTRLLRLEQLNLRSNLLTDWPEGALQARHLHSLDLSNNDITSIPVELFYDSHATLLAGTRLEENQALSQESLHQLRDYSDAHGRNEVLGLTYTDIDLMIDDLSTTTGSTDDSVWTESEPEADEVLEPPVESELDEQVTPWIANIPHDEVRRCRALWQRLVREPDNAAFFHLLSRMPDTEEFRIFRADLTRRVWDIIEAAEGSQELRETLFSMATTHTTCVDGRTLALSEIEVKVFEYNALRNLRPGVAAKGQALLALSRQLFRLGEVEKLAAGKIEGNADPAEVRLQYRIGLTQGWEDGLPLPGQPHQMRFARPITGDELARVRAVVMAAERSERFYEELITRDYWVKYLNEKYPDEFAALERSADEKLEGIEDAHEDVGSTAYRDALQMLEVERSIERNQKLIALSRLETGEPASAPFDDHQPGSSRQRMDTSLR